MRAQELFIFLPNRVDGACHKLAEVRSWGGDRLNAQDMKANKTPSFTQDHEALHNTR